MLYKENFVAGDENKMETAGVTTTPGTEEPPDSKFNDLGRAASMLQGFSKLYLRCEFIDVTLCVGAEEFPCHKNVLAVSSPYFSAMFSGALAESLQDRIQIQEMDALTMSAVLQYIYTGDVTLSEDSVQNLLSAANLFQLIPLRDGCAKYMMKHVAVSNCIGIYFFALAHECDELAARAKEIINSQFGSLCKEPEFLSLPHDKLIKLVQDDQINVGSEETVYEACWSWLNYTLEDRKQYLVEVIKCVRFANISCYFFCDNIDNNSLFKEQNELRDILDRVKYYNMLRNRQREIDLNYLPRKGMTYSRVVFIMANPYSEDSSRKFNSMEALLPKTGELKHVCKLPQSLYMPGTCITGDNQVFLAGGAIRKVNYRGPFSSEGVAANMYSFDQNFGSWQVKAKLNMGRCQFALVVVDGAIFAVGGQNETTILDNVERFDKGSNSWSQVAPLPQPLRCLTGLSYRGRLYVFGGESTSEISDAAYRYDPTEDRWVALPPMQVARALAGSVVYQDKIYVIGGNSSISPKWKKELLPEHCIPSVEVFDPVTGQWSLGPELPNALCGAGVLKYDNTIMVVGGEDDKSWMAGQFVLREDASGNHHWEEGHELPSVMSTFGYVVANMLNSAVRADYI